MAEKSTDHDLLIELKTEFKGFVVQYTRDIKDLKDGTKALLDEHEARIKTTESKVRDIENSLLTIGGVSSAWSRFEAVEKKITETETKAKFGYALAGAVGAGIATAIGIVTGLLGLWRNFFK